jgi:hypothetical protein
MTDAADVAAAAHTLFAAIRDGNVEFITGLMQPPPHQWRLSALGRRLSRAGVKDEAGNTPLHAFALTSPVKWPTPVPDVVLMWVMASHVDDVPAARNDAGDTALVCAARMGNVSFVEAAIMNDLSVVNVLDAAGRTAFDVAAEVHGPGSRIMAALADEVGPILAMAAEQKGPVARWLDTVVSLASSNSARRMLTSALYRRNASNMALVRKLLAAGTSPSPDALGIAMSHYWDADTVALLLPYPYPVEALKAALWNSLNSGQLHIAGLILDDGRVDGALGFELYPQSKWLRLGAVRLLAEHQRYAGFRRTLLGGQIRSSLGSAQQEPVCDRRVRRCAQEVGLAEDLARVLTDPRVVEMPASAKDGTGQLRLLNQIVGYTVRFL